MPSMTQSLTWLYLHTKAKLSMVQESPLPLWIPLLPEDKEKLIYSNMYDINQMYVLTFKILLPSQTQSKLPIMASFLFLTPRWYLTHPNELVISTMWKTRAHSSSHNILIQSPQNKKIPAIWFMVKQNDPDLQQIMIWSMIEDKPFILPHSEFMLVPQGITPPILNTKHIITEKKNFDPFSKENQKKGHNIYYSEAMPQQWIFNPPSDHPDPE